MIRNAILIIALAIVICKAVTGDVVLSRKYPFCGFVGGRIYCYGGDTSATSDERLTDTNLYYLDITQFADQKTDSLSNKWEKVIPRTPFDPELRNHPNAAVLSDGKRILLHGGLYYPGGKFVNQTIIYDTSTNSWETAPPYVESDRGIRQIYLAAAVNLPSGAVGFYGGREQRANISVPQISASGIHVPYNDKNTSNVGFATIRVYTPEARTWSSLSPQLDSPANFYPNSQIGILNPESQIVYYIGGSYYTPNATVESKVNFGWAHTFNTKTGIWLNQTLGGEIPTAREYHSAKLMPNSADIILYGGSEDYTKASLDYCYTLNLITNGWTKQKDLNVPTSLSGPRYAHSTVIVNTTLFVLFGRNLDGALSPSILTIDVANVSNIFYKDRLVTEVPEVTINNGTSIPPSSTGLSKGAIGGIAAGGAVAGVLVIITAALCYVRRKRRTKKEEAHIPTEQIYVDWDKIDSHYKEVPAVGHSATASPLSTNSMNTTEVGSNSPETTADVHIQQSPLLADSYISKDRINHHQVNQFDSTSYDTEVMHIVNPSIHPGLVKPSTDDRDIHFSVVKPDVA